MQKRHTIVAMIVLISLFISGCASGASGSELNEEGQIGIITNAPTQSYVSIYAEKLEEQSKKSGTPLVINANWPENFHHEQEQVQQIILDMLGDPKINALILHTINPAAGRAIEEAATLRTDFFSVGCVAADDDAITASQVDLVLSLDRTTMGSIAVEQANRMCAKTFVYYYLPIAHNVPFGIYKPVDLQQFEVTQQTCADFGVDFIPVAIPQGIGLEPNLADFFAKDIPEKVAEYGADTAFYSNKCASQPPMLAHVIEQGAIYPLPCCPSPYHGVSQTLGIEINEDSYGDYEDIHLQVSKLLAEQDAGGRLASFMVDYIDLELRAAYEYAVKWLHGEVSGEGTDLQVLQEIMEDIAGTTCRMRYFEEDGIIYDNYILYSPEPYIIE